MSIVSSEMASGTVRFFERMMSRERAITRPSTLEQLQLTPAQVRAQVAASAPLSPDEVRRAMARQVKPRSVGRGGLPDYVVKAMYADYLQLKSLAKTGKVYGRTRQAMFDIFASRGLALLPRKFHAKISYGGRNWAPGKHGYYRATQRKRTTAELLHHQVWIDVHGAIPAGHQVFFKDGDKTNFALENLGCLPIREVTLYHHRRKTGQGRAA